jgi:DNA polymerase elongation subunit (family B)
MPSDFFYTNVSMIGDYILYRGIKDGQPTQIREKYNPTLFLPTNEKTKYRTLDGKFVEPIKPGQVSDCRDFVRRYDGIQGFQVYGNTDYVYQFIGDIFPKEVDYDIDKIKIATIDIETTCEDGFPQISDPNEKVITITYCLDGKYFVFGLGEFELPEEYEQYSFDNEEDLLRTFLELWSEDYPDIVTGWNIKFFDIPYLVNRMIRVLGEREVNVLSPWKKIRSKTIQKMNREHETFQIMGVSVLDYLDLYRNFTYINQESYRLDHIANVELGDAKLSYDEFDSMAEFYKNDFQKFIEYNIVDVELVQQLEEKLKLIELSLALAYSAKVNFEDVFSQVRTWDAIIYHYLREQNIVIPPKTIGKKTDQYAGAYVKEPITGMHDWVVSFDLNSLYPHLIEMYNISPETLTDDGIWRGLDVDKILDKTPDTLAYIEKHKSKNLSVAATGNTFRTDAKGFLPSLMNKMYAERKEFKNKMIECQKQKEKDPTNKDLDYQIAKFHNFQQVRKIQLNSAYGAIGNQYFRYYSTELAESITLSGQLSIRWIMNALNEFLNTTLETTNYDYVVASDTDSVYLRLGNLVDRILPDCDDKDKITNFLDKSSKEIIIPFIKKKYDELSSLMNAYENKMVMDREVIADKGIWTAKKRYMLNVIDSEGVRYETPKMKIMGIETSRSSTPAVVRKKLKEVIGLIMSTDEDTIIQFIEEFRSEFNQLDPEEISFPRSVSGIKKYQDSNTVYGKGTPIAVKGSLIYNRMITNSGLTRKYRSIGEGDKVKFTYLKVPNPTNDHVISFPNSLPKELDIHRFVNYDLQFDKSFLDPLKNILNVVGWNTEKVNTLESFFA